MFTENFKYYKKAFVFGTGGGNDILSAIIPALHLKKLGVSVDIGGVLSPAAIHTFDGVDEKVINKIKNVNRYINTENGLKSIDLIDNYIPDATKSILPDSKFYDISFKFGTDKLVEDFNNFIYDNGYDLVVAVDVGGDILGTSADTHLLSPMMDFTSLYLLRHLKVNNFLVEFGIGTDGELRPGRIKDILKELDSVLLHSMTLKKEDEEVVAFEKLFDNIKHIRQGHTNVMTLETLNTDEDIITEYRHRTQIGDKKWFHKFMVILKKEYHGKVWLFDGKSLSTMRTETAFSYKTSHEQMMRLKELCPYWKTEMDMFEVDDVFYLTPSLMIDGDTRNEIIEYGKNNITKKIWYLKMKYVLVMHETKLRRVLMKKQRINLMIYSPQYVIRYKIIIIHYIIMII